LQPGKVSIGRRSRDGDDGEDGEDALFSVVAVLSVPCTLSLHAITESG
jgi:hypothetical protein